MFDMGFDDRYDKSNPKRNKLADRELDKETILKERRETEKLYKKILENSMKGARKKGDDIPLRNSLRDLRERDLFGWRSIKKQDELLKQNQLALNISMMDPEENKTGSAKNPKEPGFKMGFLKRNKIKQQELDRQLELERIAHLKQLELKAQTTRKLHDLEFHVLSSASQELKQGFLIAIVRCKGPKQDHELPQAYGELLASKYSDFLGSKFLSEVINQTARYCRRERIHEDEPDPELIRLINTELTGKLIEIANLIKQNKDFDDEFKHRFLERMDAEYRVYLEDIEKEYAKTYLEGTQDNCVVEIFQEHRSEQISIQSNNESITSPSLKDGEPSTDNVHGTIKAINSKSGEPPTNPIGDLSIAKNNASIKQIQIGKNNGSPFQKFQAQLLPNLNSLKDGMLVVDVETPDLKDRRILSIGIAFWDKQTGEVKQLFYQKTKPSDFGTVDKNAWTFANRNLDYDEIAAMPETDYSALRCNDPVTGEEIGLYELFLRYPATGFNVSRFDIPALQSAGIVPEEYAAPFDLSDACKHLVKGRTRQISEEDTFRLLFNNGNYAEKHIAIDDAMDEARILGEVYKIANNPAVFDEIREKKTNPLQPMQSILNSPKQMQTEIRMHQIKALEGKPYVGVQTLATEKYMTDPLRAKLCEIWYAERCRRNADLPHVSEDPKQAEAEFNALLKDIKQFKVIYTSEGLNDEEMKAISDELAENGEIAVVVQSSSNGSASSIESGTKKPRKGLDLYVADSTAEEDFEPAYIEHGDQHIFSINKHQFMYCLAEFDELTKLVSQFMSDLEKKSTNISISLIGKREHKLYEVLFSSITGIPYHEIMLRTKSEKMVDNAILFSNENKSIKEYFIHHLLQLLQNDGKYENETLKKIYNSFDSTILIKCDYTSSNDVGYIAKKLINYPIGFRGLDKLFIVVNDYDYDHPRIHSDIVEDLTKTIELTEKSDYNKPEIIEYLDNLKHRLFVMNIPAWFSLFKSNQNLSLLKNLKTHWDLENDRAYYNYLGAKIAELNHMSNNSLQTVEIQRKFENGLIEVLIEKGVQLKFIESKNKSRLDFDAIFDIRNIFKDNAKSMRFHFVKPSLTQINQNLSPFGIKHIAQTQKQLEQMYLDRETKTKWHRDQCQHTFTASKTLIDDRIEAGLNPCTICNPPKNTLTPTLNEINAMYKEHGIEHNARNQTEFEESYMGYRSDTVWRGNICNHEFRASRKLIDKRIKSGLNPCTICNPPRNTVISTLKNINEFYKNHAIKHDASTDKEFEESYMGYRSDTVWRRSICNHVFKASRQFIDNRIKLGLNPCTICNPPKNTLTPTLNEINAMYKEHGIEHNARNQSEFEALYMGYRPDTIWRRRICNHVFKASRELIDKRIKSGLNPCTMCNPLRKAKKE